MALGLERTEAGGVRADGKKGVMGFRKLSFSCCKKAPFLVLKREDGDNGIRLSLTGGSSFDF